MTHSQYIELTSLLQGFTANAGTLRLVFSKVEIPADPDTLEPGRPATKKVTSDQAKQHPGFPFRYRMLDNEEKAVRETLELMDGTVDTWTDENQVRADKGEGPTADVRELYSAMSAFMDATETPVDGAGVLYIRLRNKVRAWMDQALEWFPHLYPQIVRDLLESDYYQLAVRAGYITPPFIWNGRVIKDLAMWLAEWMKTNTVYGSGKRDWESFDRVFRIGGVRITNTQLSNALKW